MPFEPASDLLQPYRVLDLSRVRAGPTCVRQLADWGADVIKIESPPAEAAKQTRIGGTRDGPDFQNLHRNKRSMTLNLKAEKGVAIFGELVRGADVVVENYRPAVKHRLGIDYEALRPLNEGLVYASISGFGQDGPDATRAGFDQIAQGMGGLMSVTGEPGRGPMRAGIPVADLTAGLLAAQGILMALLARTRTGKGQWVQTSLLQAQVFMLDFQAARWLIDREVPGQAGNDHPTGAPTGVFPTKDGHINLAVGGGAMWRKFCDLLGDPRLEAPEFADEASRLANRAALNALIGEHTARQSSAHWIETCNAAGVPAGPINAIDQVFASPQVQHLGMAQDMVSQERGATRAVGQPIVMGAGQSRIARPPPLLGQHTAEVLAEIGYDEDAVAELAAEGVV